MPYFQHGDSVTHDLVRETYQHVLKQAFSIFVLCRELCAMVSIFIQGPGQQHIVI